MTNKISTAIVLLCAFASTHVQSAVVDQQEFDTLVAQAQQRGAVRVMVTLAPVSLAQLRDSRTAIEADMRVRTTDLLRELGNTAWKAGYWSNGLGQIGVYVTPTGLQRLAASKKATAFGADPTHRMRSRFTDLDGRIAALEQGTASGNVIQAELSLNVDSFDFDIPSSTPSLVHRHTPALSAETDSSIANLRAVLREVAPKTAGTLRKHGSKPGSAIVDLDAQTLAALLESPLLRSIKPADYSDTRNADIDPELLAHANQRGGAEVLVELRLPDGIALSSRQVPARAWEAQKRALNAVFREIVAALPGASIGQEFEGIGSAVMRLDEAAARQLVSMPDSRILRVSVTKPSLSGALQSSIPTIRMNAAHSYGYTAPGQHVVVLDSGVRKSHALFGGSEKVVFEGCWGTDSPTSSPPVVSACPGKNAQGDSPIGLGGSGEPISCPTGSLAYCSFHGTHVAGITAGRINGLNGYSGTAPSARLVSFNIASWTSAYEWRTNDTDMSGALQAVRDLAPDSTFTINMSIGRKGFKTTADCPSLSQTITAIVQNLFDRGIPVVVSAGNDGTLAPRLGVSYPACIPRTVKAGATVNDGMAVTVASASNIVPHASMTGPIILAPGFNVSSATQLSDTSMATAGGTSMAAPHVAGYYAMLKAIVPTWGVADLSAWIIGSGSVNVSLNVAGTIHNLRRIQAPL